MSVYELTPHDDFKIETWPPRQIGGQHAGSGPSGVRIEHLPTQTISIYIQARSQHVNRMIATEMMIAALTHPRFNK